MVFIMHILLKIVTWNVLIFYYFICMYLVSKTPLNELGIGADSVFNTRNNRYQLFIKRAVNNNFKYFLWPHQDKILKWVFYFFNIFFPVPYNFVSLGMQSL